MLALLPDRRSPETCCVAHGSEFQAGSALNAVVQISLRRIMEVDSFPYVFVVFSSIGHRPFPPTSRSSFLFPLFLASQERLLSGFEGSGPWRPRCRIASTRACSRKRSCASSGRTASLSESRSSSPARTAATAVSRPRRSLRAIARSC